MKNWLPCLQRYLGSVVGCHYLQVFGAVWNGAKCVCIDPLCSPFSMLFVPCDPNHSVSKLARLLYVIDKTPRCVCIIDCFKVFVTGQWT